MQLSEALSKFLVQLQADGRAEPTLAQRRRHVLALERWLAEEGHATDVEALTHETLAAFVASPAARTRPDGGVKRASSVNQLRSSLKGFGDYLHRAGILDTNPSRLLRLARCGTAPPKTLSEPDCEALLRTLAHAEKTDPLAARDHLLFHVLLGTGIRVGSALALEARDVDLARKQITLRVAKGDRPEVVLTGSKVTRHLRRYLRGRDPGPLFPGPHGRPLSARYVRQRLATWLKRAGIESTISPHSLRHSFAAGLYERTGDVLLVQQAMRHKSVASTLVYAHADSHRVRQALG